MPADADDVVFLIVYLVTLMLGLAAVVCGIVGFNQVQNSPRRGTGLGRTVAGLVFGSLLAAFMLLMTVVAWAAVNV